MNGTRGGYWGGWGVRKGARYWEVLCKCNLCKMEGVRGRRRNDLSHVSLSPYSNSEVSTSLRGNCFSVHMMLLYVTF